MKLVFATNNKHKLEEIRDILGPGFEILSLSDIGCHEDIPETEDTIDGNSHQKAFYVATKYDVDCFADDTGLEVEALGGEPGVHSARYAEGTDHDSEANMAKLLRKLGNNNNRRARFRTCITLIQRTPDGFLNCNYFNGEVSGTIAKEKHGHEGFGYDPIFIPDGYDKSFAELGEDVKNKISHRARAVAQLAEFLKS